MGRIVAAIACTHTLDPSHFPGEWKSAAIRVGQAVRQLGSRIRELKPDALVIIANDHYNAFSFAAVPAICVRVGTNAVPMKEYDMPQGVYDHLGSLVVHDDLATRVLHDSIGAGFDLCMSWEAPLDHAFLEPLRFMELAGSIPPLVPIWINCLVAPQPSPSRVYRFGQLLRRVIEAAPFNVALLATGGLYHFPGLKFDRLGESHADFDQAVIKLLTTGRGEKLGDFTTDQLCEAGEHELLNWTVLAGAVGGSRARLVSYELCKGLAGIGVLSWDSIG
jgi:aromatic ring-opening dioxygenase catalytic subunit (LigB family)